MSLLSSYLMHHGIKGQKWGVRNGPPYPLNEYSAESQHRAVSNLSKELNTEWEYGVLHNGKHINTEMEDFDWSQYRTIPVDTLRKEKIGTCWDYVNYESKVLNDAGIKNKAYLLMMDLRSEKDPDRIVTHTFSTFTLNGKNYWLESAMWPKRGIHEISDVSEIAKDVANVYSDKKPYALYEYDPKGMDNGLTGEQFVQRATKNKVLESTGKR